MKIAIVGATGSLGRECLGQALEAEHRVTVLARTPPKLPAALTGDLDVLEGDATDAGLIDDLLSRDVEVVLFALGVDRHSPE